MLYFKGSAEAGSNGMVAVSFIVGAICSALAGFIGMKVATKANVRTTNAARTSLGRALEVAFAGGAVMGLRSCRAWGSRIEWFVYVSTQLMAWY